MNALQNQHSQLILASASKVRASMLTSAGLTFDIVPSNVDEDVIKETLHRDNQEITPSDIAVVLAQTKADDVSGIHPDALVIGADQVLFCDGRLYDKPRDIDEARDHLLSLKGRTHTLHTAVACAQEKSVVWYHDAQVSLTMRDFSNEFLGRYIVENESDLLSSVGAYKLEGTGSHLFEKIEGDFFSVLGLPLIPLLAFLRENQVIIS